MCHAAIVHPTAAEVTLPLPYLAHTVAATSCFKN